MAKTTQKTSKKTAAKAAGSGTTPAKKKTAAKKATAKKTATKKTPVKKATAKKKVVARKTTVAAKATSKKVTARQAAPRRITAGDARQMIAEAAYLRGQAQGFLSDEREDWLLAEAEVNTLLSRAKITVLD